MDKLSQCPNSECGNRPGHGFFDGCYFDVYACDDCNKRYCYECPCSERGTACPKCGCRNAHVIAQVWR